MQPLLNKERALGIMKEKGIEAIIATIPENVLYASGFRSLSQWLIRGQKTPCVVVLKADGDLTLIAPAGELDRAACHAPAVDRIIAFNTVTVEVGDQSTWLPEDYQYASIALSDNRPADVWAAFVQLGIEKLSSIAIDDPDLSAAFTKRFSHQVMDARPIWLSIRLIKTPAEIARLRKTVEITEYAIQQSMEAARVGMSEKELNAIFQSAILQAGGKPYLNVIGAGTFGAYPNHEPGDYCLQMGDLIRWDVGCSYEGYVADFARTACIGTPNERQTTYWNAVLAGQKAAMAAIKPGVAAADIYHIGIEAARKAGLPHIRRKHIGHGIGIDMYERPSLSPSETLVLEQGMVFELEVLYYELGFGSVHVEDTIHVTADGYECLTSLAHQLFILSKS